MLANVILLFPLWAIVCSVVAFFFPDAFVVLKPYIVPLLTFIMFSMGMTLCPADFVRALAHPKAMFLGVVAQYVIMPAAAYLLSVLLGLSTELMVGMVLVGSVAGGTASNVITYLAKGDVALSITMTLLSTLLSVVVTPYLTLLYVGQTVPVPATAMLISIAKMVMIPLFFGLVFNHLLGARRQRIEPWLPFLSMVAIVTIIAIVVALNRTNLTHVGPLVFVAVALHNGLGLAVGYTVAWLFGFDSKVARTVAIEVGMQNSGLGVALASQYFAPLSTLPGAVFSIWHNISGSILAGFWGRADHKGEGLSVAEK
nr:bile acid:sodium symporter family protein [uncultured Desulfuromonas sp.]